MSSRLMREALSFNYYSIIIITLSKSAGLETAPKKGRGEKKGKDNQQKWTAVSYYRRNFSLQHPGLVDPGGGTNAKGCGGLSTLLSALGQEGQRWDLVAFGEESGIKPTATDGCPATAGLGGQEITSDPPFYDSQLSSNAKRRRDGGGEAASERRDLRPEYLGTARGGGAAARGGEKSYSVQWEGGEMKGKKTQQKTTEVINHGAICEEMRHKIAAAHSD